MLKMANAGGNLRVFSFSGDSLDCFEYFCQPCSEQGQSLEAEGYCEDCKEFLCGSCYDVHKIPSALRHHVLLDKKGIQKLKPPVLDTVTEKCPQDTGTEKCPQDTGTEKCPQDTGTEKCPQHNEDMGFFCSTHAELACRTCKAIKHQTCDSVVGISPDIANSCEYIKQALDEMERKLQEVGVMLKRKKTEADAVFTVVAHDIKMFKDEIVLLLDDMEKALIQSAEIFQRNDKERMASKADSISSMSNEVQSLQTEVQTLEDKKQTPLLFLAMKKAEERLQTVKISLDGLDPEDNITQYKFLPNLQVKRLLGEPTALGRLIQRAEAFDRSDEYCSGKRCPKLHRHSSITSDPSCESLSEVSEDDIDAEEQPIASDDVFEEPLEVTPLEDLYVDSRYSKHPCWITGATIVGEKLVLTDYNNTKVNVICLENNETMEMKMTSGPWDVAEIDDHDNGATYPDSLNKEATTPRDSQLGDVACGNDCQQDSFTIRHSQPKGVIAIRERQLKAALAIRESKQKEAFAFHDSHHKFPDTKHSHSQHEVAVTLPDRHQITLLKIGNKVTKHKRIKVSGECYGIAYNKGKLLVTYKNPAKVEIMDITGKVLRKIENDGANQGLFSFPAYITLSPNGEMIYVSDKENNSITCISINGKIEKILKDDVLQHPSKLTVDTDGNVFVCGRDSKNVVVTDSEMSRVRVLLSTMTPPYSLCYKPDTGRLYVALFGNNKIKVYLLSN